MPPQHERDDAKDVAIVSKLVGSAADLLHVINQCLITKGALTLEMIDAVSALQDDMIKIIAQCEDGILHGVVPESLIYAMRGFEEEAAQILDRHSEIRKAIVLKRT